MNGLDHYAETFAELVSELTAVPTVRYLTLLPLSDLLPRLGAGLLAKRPRWCQECLSQMIDDGMEAYRPLVWSLSSYSHCHRHGGSLVSLCPHCGRPQPAIPRYPDLFHCAHCNRSLAVSERKGPRGSELDAWTAGWLAELVALLPELDGVALRERFVSLLEQAIDLWADGNCAELARRLGMPGPTLYNWFIRDGRPRLPQLLLVAYGLQLPPAALLNSKAASPPMLVTPPALVVAPSRRHRLEQGKRDELSIVMAAIAEDAGDVRPLKEVARALGYTRWTLKYWFPEHCETICAKSMAARNRAARVHDDERRQAIVQIVEQMARRGDYPGRKRVSRLLPKGTLITTPHLISAYHDAVRRLAGVAHGGEE